MCVPLVQGSVYQGPGALSSGCLQGKRWHQQVHKEADGPPSHPWGAHQAFLWEDQRFCSRWTSKGCNQLCAADLDHKQDVAHFILVHFQPVHSHQQWGWEWDTRMNKQKARGSHNLPFYVLVDLLRKEADLLPLQRLLVDEGKLQRLQRKSSKLVQARIFRLWETYSSGDLSTYSLLKKLGKLYTPVWSLNSVKCLFDVEMWTV